MMCFTYINFRSNYCTCTAEWYWTDTGGVPYDESRDEGCSYRGP